MNDGQGSPVNPPITGNTVEITVVDPTRQGQFLTAFQGAVQDDATANNARNRLNGSATEYTKPA